jgi:hypothetical protein
MGGNVRNFVKGANQTIKDVATGEVAYGLAIDFYAMAMMNEAGEEKIGYVMPEGLTVVNPDAIVILKGAPHLPVAEAFIRFVLSREGQKLWLYKKGVPGGPVTYQLNRLSVTPALYTEHPEYNAVSINPFEWRSGFRYDANLGSQRWRILNDLIGVMVIDTKDRLTTVWQEIIGRGATEEEIRRLSRMPVTEDEALTYAKERWDDDTEFRNRTIAAWTAFALEKYRSEGEERDRFYQRFWAMIVGIGIGVVGLLYLWRVNRR